MLSISVDVSLLKYFRCETRKCTVHKYNDTKLEQSDFFYIHIISTHTLTYVQLKILSRLWLCKNYPIFY